VLNQEGIAYQTHVKRGDLAAISGIVLGSVTRKLGVKQ
jgi:hypothetical protein